MAGLVVSIVGSGEVGEAELIALITVASEAIVAYLVPSEEVAVAGAATSG